MLADATHARVEHKWTYSGRRLADAERDYAANLADALTYGRQVQ